MQAFTLSLFILALGVALLDSLLSVDNALANAAQAQDLPAQLRKSAITLGMTLGAVFRLIALAAVQWVVRFSFCKLIGAGWLFWLTGKYCYDRARGKPDEPESDEQLAKQSKAQQNSAFLKTIAVIGVTDITFSINNVIAAVGLSTDLRVLAIGAVVSIAVMIFATQFMSALMQRYPRLELTTYVIIGFIGLTIVFGETYKYVPFFPCYEFTALQKFGFTLTAVVLTILLDEIAVRRSKRTAADPSVPA